MANISADVGRCSKCSKDFGYRLVHNGFNDSAYAYCDVCGRTALLSGWFNEIPRNVELKLHQKITEEIERYLEPCECGGKFTHDASPRCPDCQHEISAMDASEYIEKNAPGTLNGWRWQRSWDGLYCIVIKDRVVADNWKREII